MFSHAAKLLKDFANDPAKDVADLRSEILVRVTLWGTRGSLATPGPETNRYGGNTACVEVEGVDGTCLVLDAGTGIRRLGAQIPNSMQRVDVLLTHLHLDHIQGLGFFRPMRHPGYEVHIWGPASTIVLLSIAVCLMLRLPKG